MCGGFGHGECESGAGLAGFGIGGPNLTIFVFFFTFFRSEARFVEDSGTVNPNPGPVWLDSASGAKF